MGEVVGVFGIRGELKVRLETDFPDRFAKLNKVCLRPPSAQPALYEIESARLHKTQVLLKLKGVNSIERAQTLRGCRVQIPRSDAVPLPKNSYYAADIVGMEVVTRDGKALGRLDKVLQYPAHDLFQVGEVLIPAVKEMVIEMDTANRRIVVVLPEGLLPHDEPETAE